MARKSMKATRLPEYWRDVAWQASGSSLAQLVGVAGIPVLTRLYTPGDFAVQSLFIQVVTFTTALVTWRYEYFIQLPKEEAGARALNALTISLGLLVVVILTPSFWLCRELLARQIGNQDVAFWLFLAPITAAFVSWAIASQNNALRQGDYRSSGLSELAGKTVYVLVGIAGAFAHLGALGLIITTAMGAMGKSIYVLLQKPFAVPKIPRLQDIRQVRVQYGSLATSTVISHLLSTSATALPQIAVARLYGVDVLGQYALVIATIYLPSGLLGAAIGQVYFQRAAQLRAEGKWFYNLWRQTALKLLVIGVPVYGAVMLLSEFAYPFIFGPQWHLAGEIATWLAIAAFGSFVSSPMDRTCLVVGVWRYQILWSIFRLTTAGGVVLLAWLHGLTPQSFIVVLVVQMCTVYAVDMVMGRRFSQGQFNGFIRS